MKDYYQILGVPENADEETIKKAFRELAKKYHPDVPGGDADKFKEILEAYRVLSDKKLRAEYDTQRRWQTKTGFDIPGFDFDFFRDFEEYFKDFVFDFEDIFGTYERKKTKRNLDIYLNLEISLKEYYEGTKKEIRYLREKKCSYCQGTGSENKKKVICKNCQGKGKIITSSSILESIFFNQLKTCPVCRGEGYIPEKLCSFCHGAGYLKVEEKVNIEIPPKSRHSQIILKNMGNEADLKTGDLIININIRIEKPFSISNKKDLVYEYKINILDVLLKDEIEIPFFGKKIYIKNPPEGDIIKFSNLGLYGGDLLIKLNFQFPKLTKKQKDDLKKFLGENLI
ncbi:MAG: hypothetical protein C4348_01340 [Patescibacteria group bacterium]